MLYVISGCSGGGKSTLVDALALRGFDISEEPGRTIVRQELHASGDALPWINPIAFSEKCAELSISQYAAATQLGEVVFFDRSLIDAVSALVHEQPEHAEAHFQRLQKIRYASTVFMASPWPDIFENDPERQHCFADAVAEYDRLVDTYRMADYSIVFLPKSSVSERVDFVTHHIDCISRAALHQC